MKWLRSIPKIPVFEGPDLQPSCQEIGSTDFPNSFAIVFSISESCARAEISNFIRLAASLVFATKGVLHCAIPNYSCRTLCYYV